MHKPTVLTSWVPVLVVVLLPVPLIGSSASIRKDLTNPSAMITELSLVVSVDLKSAGFGPTMSSSTNDTIVVPTSIVFQEIINVDPAIGEVTYTALSNLSQINGNVKYQTFVVTADAVPTGYVLGDYQLPNGSSLLPNGPVQIPVPEPFTILGSLAALGFGVFGQKEYAKKQSQNSNSDLT